jgi:hypothetical protein
MNSVFFNHINKQEIEEKLHSGEFPFSQNLFWDIPIEKIDRQKNKRHIIERVITRGLLEDFYTLLQLYSTNEIADAITRSKVLDSKTANFCSIVFNIPKSSIHVSPYYS